MNNETQKLQDELSAFNAKRKAQQEALRVECNAPEITKTYTYRASTSIRVRDLCL